MKSKKTQKRYEKINPVMFSSVFDVGEDIFLHEGLFEPSVNVDTKLSVDPTLLSGSSNKYARDSIPLFNKFFQDLFTRIESSEEKDDMWWESALHELTTREFVGTCLGYGRTVAGNGFGTIKAEDVLTRAKKLIDKGNKNPELFYLVSIFSKGVGPDLIGDMTTRIIASNLFSLTEEFARKYNIPMFEYNYLGRYKINAIENPMKKKTPIVLVPADILRDLPSFLDGRLSSEYTGLVAREQVKILVGDNFKTAWSVKEQRDKDALFKKLIENDDFFNAHIKVLSSMKGDAYDLNQDRNGLYFWYKISEILSPSKFDFNLNIKKDAPVRQIVDLIIQKFRSFIEDNGLSNELWYKDKITGVYRNRRERSAQMLFMIVAKMTCEHNNIDCSPEVNSGSGSVDFKFSRGDEKVIVEIKKTSHTRFVHGYEKQIETYRKAEGNLTEAIFLIIITSDGKKLREKMDKLYKIEADRKQKKLPTATIEVVDGRRQESASKKDG